MNSNRRRSAPPRLDVIPALSRALDILEFLQNEKHPKSLQEIFKRTCISRTTVFRILTTFVQRGYITRSKAGMYRLIMKPRKVRFGFGAESLDTPFSQEVRRRLVTAAATAGIDLLILDNKHDATAATQDAEEFVRQRVDLVIAYQVDRQLAPTVADRIHAAEIPLIAVNVPQPHAFFLGVDNYHLGYETGVFLAQHAKTHWHGEVSWALGLDNKQSDPSVQSRITGAFAGIRAKLPNLDLARYIALDTEGMLDQGRRVTAEFLKRYLNDRGVLIAAGTDASALGALQAVREAKRELDVAIVGQQCIPETLSELSAPGTPLIASVSHEPANYGVQLIQLRLAVLNKQTVPPYNYVKHRLMASGQTPSDRGRRDRRVFPLLK